HPLPQKLRAMVRPSRFTGWMSLPFLRSLSISRRALARRSATGTYRPHSPQNAIALLLTIAHGSRRGGPVAGVPHQAILSGLPRRRYSECRRQIVAFPPAARQYVLQWYRW